MVQWTAVHTLRVRVPISVPVAQTWSPKHFWEQPPELGFGKFLNSAGVAQNKTKQNRKPQNNLQCGEKNKGFT